MFFRPFESDEMKLKRIDSELAHVGRVIVVLKHILRGPHGPSGPGPKKLSLTASTQYLTKLLHFQEIERASTKERKRVWAKLNPELARRQAEERREQEWQEYEKKRDAARAECEAEEAERKRLAAEMEAKRKEAQEAARLARMARLVENEQARNRDRLFGGNMPDEFTKRPIEGLHEATDPPSMAPAKGVTVPIPRSFARNEPRVVSHMRSMTDIEPEGFFTRLFGAGTARSRHVAALEMNLRAVTAQSNILEIARNTERAEYTHVIQLAVDEAMAQNQLTVAQIATDNGWPAAEYGANIAKKLAAQLEVWVNHEAAHLQAGLNHQEHIYRMVEERERKLTDIAVERAAAEGSISLVMDETTAVFRLERLLIEQITSLTEELDALGYVPDTPMTKTKARHLKESIESREAELVEIRRRRVPTPDRQEIE